MKRVVCLGVLIAVLFLLGITRIFAGAAGSFIWGTVSLKMEPVAGTSQNTAQSCSAEATKKKVKDINGVKNVEIDEAKNEMTVTCEGECTDAIIDKIKKELEKDGIKLTKKDNANTQIE